MAVISLIQTHSKSILLGSHSLLDTRLLCLTAPWTSVLGYSQHLKLSMPKTEFLTVSPKLPLPMVSPISLKGNTLPYLLRPKAFELSLIPLFPISHLVYQQILQAGSYIHPEFPFLPSLLPSVWYKPLSYFTLLTAMVY